MPTSLQKQVRVLLAAHADPVKAEQARAYMKSALPYAGVALPAFRVLLRPVFATLDPADRAAFEGHVRTLFHEADVREERYAALALLRDRRFKALRDARTMDLVEELVVAGAWWDLVDELAHVTGELLERFPKPTTTRLRKWARSDDLWLRRSAIIAQLGRKTATDEALLTDAIEHALDSKEFFLRKAIGWALRSYADTDPDWVRFFVAEHPTLSPLSRKEALRKLFDAPIASPAARTRRSKAGTSRRKRP